ncbi:MAG: pyridoxamine 5'-phosphate oxidase family protein [Ilumatobacteraceae bacterium]
MSDENIKNYEDVTVYSLEDDREQELIDQQKELSLCWVTKDGSPMAVIMSYFRAPDGTFWMTASGQRKRIPAMRRDPRVAIVITSTGTSMKAGKTVSYKGIATIHEDAETKAWFYPELAKRLYGGTTIERENEFANMLNSPRRVVISIAPGLRVGYDGDKMRLATDKSREAGTLKFVD